ncbi:hypothetical protein PV963_30100 [Streptomyces coeruleorubidus]|uniref:hypothetical protein n=1 Tax=Streptomyces coeruleorubidus TaxID=116188 RepID=UPI00237FB18D|nr:hypothetical protein [Streptomyces coeruleorubidus]WDV54309.1 hypothetical protein PV963_30100 [Streptomyces coeruleorubidus]
MRGTIRLTCTAGLVVGVLVAGLTACTGGHGRRQGRQGPQDRHGRGDGLRGRHLHLVPRNEVGEDTTRSAMRRIHSPRPPVRAGGPAPFAAEVLFPLGKKTGEIESDARTLAEAGKEEAGAFTDVHRPEARPRPPPDRRGGRVRPVRRCEGSGR